MVGFCLRWIAFGVKDILMSVGFGFTVAVEIGSMGLGLGFKDV